MGEDGAASGCGCLERASAEKPVAEIDDVDVLLDENGAGEGSIPEPVAQTILIGTGAGQVPAEARPGDVHSRADSPPRAEAAPQWIRIEGRILVADGKPIRLRGIGLGNWMLVEHFMIGLPQVDYVMRQTFTEVLGPERAAE